MHIFKEEEKKSAGCRGSMCIVTPLCTNNDGMENHNRNWGVVFKVAEKMRDAGVRLPSSSSSSSPPPPLPHHPPCTLQFRMGLCVYETLGFQGMDKAAEGKERQGWRAAGWGGVGGEDGGGGERQAAYISQCTQRTGHLIYIELHGCG